MGLEIPGVIHQAKQAQIIKDNKLEKNTIKIRQANKEVKKNISSEDLEKSVQTLESTALLFDKRLKIRVNRDINRIVVKVIDARTDKVIKEIPPIEMQKLIARLKQVIGLLVDEKI
jgi:flagellar protein FlaG